MPGVAHAACTHFYDAGCPVSHHSKGSGCACSVVILKLRGNFPELRLAGEKSRDDAGIKMAADPFHDDGFRLVMAEGRFVDPLRDERIVDIRHRHQAPGERNILTRQPSRIAAAIPLFVVGEGDLPSQPQEGGGGG